MKHYRVNQIAMAVLGALLLFFGTRTIINIATEEHEPEKPGLEVAGGDEKPKEEEKPAEAASEVIPLLATADAKQGEADAALCKVCHSFEKGGPVMIGPDLYDVVGRKIAGVEGFNYSPGLKAHQGVWTYANLDPWLKSPQTFAPGTMMAFPGVPDAKKRANIIAFLRANADNPAPLPEAAPAAAPAEEKPAAPAEEKPAPAEEEKPAPAEAEKPAAPPAEEKPAETPPPAAEEPAPPAETPPAADEKPAETPPAETPPAAEEEKPAETPPAAEEPAPAPSEEPAPAAEPSVGEPPSPSQPQPVYPDGASEGAESSDDAAPSGGEEPDPSWPQPVYPDGPPAGQ